MIWFACYIHFNEAPKTTQSANRLTVALVTILFFVFGTTTTVLSAFFGQADLEVILSYIYPLFWACLVLAVSAEAMNLKKTVNASTRSVVLASTTSSSSSNGVGTQKKDTKIEVTIRLMRYSQMNAVCGFVFCGLYLARSRMGGGVWINVAFDIALLALVAG